MSRFVRDIFLNRDTGLPILIEPPILVKRELPEGPKEMTEQEWLTGEDPVRLLEWLTGKPGQRPANSTDVLCPRDPPSNRKLRLFACACARQVWSQLKDERSRQAVEAAERYADGDRTRSIWDAWNAACNAWEVETTWVRGVAASCCLNEIQVPQLLQRVKRSGVSLTTQATFIRDIFGNPFHVMSLNTLCCAECRQPIKGGWCQQCGYAPSMQDTFLRKPSWFNWNNDTIPRLAQAAYDERPGQVCKTCDGKGFWIDTSPYGYGRERVKCDDCYSSGNRENGHLDPVRLAILADALEEAGCQDERILKHLRGFQESVAMGPYGVPTNGWLKSDAPHVRGCWVIDLLLGKE